MEAALIGRLAARSIELFFGRPPEVARQTKLITASGLFDPDWYQRQSGEQGAPRALLLHYLRVGTARGLDPHPLFDTDWYFSRNPDISEAGVNPLVHFLEAGGLEGRDPHPLFDSDWYLSLNPSVRDEGGNPLIHYLEFGAAAGVDPHPLFKGRWYLAQYPAVREAGDNPLRHYVVEGAAHGYDPNPLFDSDWYASVNPDAAARGVNPLVHYVLTGEAEGRAPSPLLSKRTILETAGTPARGDLVWPASHEKSAPAVARTGVDILHEDTEGTVESLRKAFEAASASRRHLLVTLNGVTVIPEQAMALVRGFDADPMIGMIAPRLASGDGHVLPLLRGDDAFDRHILTLGPQTIIAPEFLSPCLLIRHDLVANLPRSISGLTTFRGLFRGLLAWSRRLGYRALIDNRVIVSVASPSFAYPTIADDDRALVGNLFPDIAVADARFAQLPCHNREALLASADRERRSGQRHILIDCSGLAVGHSGTSEAMIGILSGFATLSRGWTVSVFSSATALKFHRLPERFPNLLFISDELVGAFSAAIRLSQPWETGDIARLHRHARKVAALMLDTIGWDIIYSLVDDVGPVWRLLAAQADGIAHISGFTRQRFNYRFPVAPHVLQTVAHLSCHYGDYVSAPHQARTSGHILLVGNTLDHKGLAAVIETLPKAFPDQQFVVIGQSDFRDANVTSVASGQMSAVIVEQLYVQARMLIFPSFYEGFGFPIVHGLGYGLDVVARRSALLSEIAAQCAPRGRLLPFDDPSSLTETVRRVLAGEAVETISLGTTIPAGGEAPGWRDTAERLAALLDELMRDTTIDSYDRRERALSLITV